MDALHIFQELIGNKIKPIILQYEPYTDRFKTYPYRHKIDTDFEKQFSNILFDSIVFYAYEKSEIEKEYSRGHLASLRRTARSAYENRVPKTEKSADGLLGELTLDCFIKCFFNDLQMLYSRVKYLERYPKQDIPQKRAGHEVKGYDGMIFSIEDEKKYMWVGQVKTGEWKYCLDGIKSDISKSILRNYFSSAMIIMSDIMRAASDVSPELEQIIDDLNDLCLEYSTEPSLLYTNVHDYFCNEHIIIRIPCLIIAEESDYPNQDALLKNIKEKCHNAFSNFSYDNDGLIVEVLLLVFPIRNLASLRENFLTVRTSYA